ncbi:MAG TPA: hypothetical protein PK252_12525 [Bacteroidales bacterium]|nr:hypothetical protein [Bacteroidales bacterium]
MKKIILFYILIFQVSYLLANDSIKYSTSLKMGPTIVPKNSELEKGKYGFNAGYCFGRHFNNVLLITTINYSLCTLLEPDWFQDKYTEDVVNADLMIGYKYQESKVLIQFSAGVSYLFGNKHGKYIPPHGLFGSRGYENI